MQINVMLVDGTPLPRHAKPGDAGMDLTARRSVTLMPQEVAIVGTGVRAEIPDGYVGLVFPRSGMASGRGITLANAVGVVDSGYRGEIMAPLLNVAGAPRHVEAGERVCQLVVVPFATCECVEVESLSETERGEGGFGSTGND